MLNEAGGKKKISCVINVTLSINKTANICITKFTNKKIYDYGIFRLFSVYLFNGVGIRANWWWCSIPQFCFSVSSVQTSGCDSIFTSYWSNEAVGTVGYFKRIDQNYHIVLVYHPLFPFYYQSINSLLRFLKKRFYHGNFTTERPVLMLLFAVIMIIASYMIKKKIRKVV
jgi:hypothetical protein